VTRRGQVHSKREDLLGLDAPTLPIAVTVVIVVPGVMVVAVMVIDLMMVAAVIIAVPPATRLGIVRGDYASE
jgi:hypothetical protein